MRTSNRRKILGAIIAIVERHYRCHLRRRCGRNRADARRLALLPSREALILAAHQHLADQWEAGMKIAGGKADTVEPAERDAAYIPTARRWPAASNF